MNDIITPEVVDQWWAAVSITLAAIGSSAVVGRQWWIARKGLQLALLVVQNLGHNYVDKWKAENIDGRLTLDQVNLVKNEANVTIEALAKKESLAVQAYIKNRTPEVIIEKAVKLRKALKAKRGGPKGGLR